MLESTLKLACKQHSKSVAAGAASALQTLLSLALSGSLRTHAVLFINALDIHEPLILGHKG